MKLNSKKYGLVQQLDSPLGQSLLCVRSQCDVSGCPLSFSASPTDTDEVGGKDVTRVQAFT